MKINVSKARVGDKLHEDLIDTANDTYKQMFENKDMFILTPDPQVYNLEKAIYRYPGFKQRKIKKSYSSKNAINRKDVERII